MRLFQEYQVNPGVLVWGRDERAYRIVRNIERIQPVTWACRHKPSFPIDAFAGRTIWGKELIYLRGKVGRFTIGLQDIDIEEIKAGAVIVVPEATRPLLSYPGVEEVKDRSVLFVLMGVTRGLCAEAFEKILNLAEHGRVGVITDQVQVGYRKGEELYTRLRRRGVVFIRTDRVPVINQVMGGPARFEAQVFDAGLGRELVLHADTLVVPHWPDPTSQLSYERLLGLGEELVDNFPGRTNREGIMVFPDSEGVMTQEEEGLVIRAMTAGVSLLAGGIVRDHKRYEVDTERCALCLTCYRRCPHQAIEIIHDEAYGNLYREACQIDVLSCRGCGLCYADCPAQAITRWGGAKDSTRLPLVLACENAAGKALSEPNNPYDYQLFPCAGAIGENEILRAMRDQARDVYVVACHQDKCQHEHQDRRLEKRVERLNSLLARLGLHSQVHLLRLAGSDSLSNLAAEIGTQGEQ